jgi:superfamily I DNA and/or RNA helicase
MDGVAEITDKAAGSWFGTHEIVLLGGTVWGIRKSLAPEGADLVIIDEGSQMRVPEAAIAIRRLTASGWLVIAGDDRQLPPIVQAEYPAPPPGTPLLHRSVFECLRAQDPNSRYTTTLLKNWRMNETLCRYPAEQVYVPEYRSATPAIATRRIRLSGGDHRDPLADEILDPDYPLVVGVLRGVRATAENRVEADLVARVVARLRSRLLDKHERLYPDDPSFWEHGVFVVSPHHAQIAAIRRELACHRTWDGEPFVGTVDKMQGQECDAVVVSYGVADPEFALGEKEFIYSLNRLNVAITRAKAKSVVLLPQTLIEPPLAAYEEETIAEGVAFMQGLIWYARRNATPVTHDLGNGASLTLSRVPAEGGCGKT